MVDYEFLELNVTAACIFEPTLCSQVNGVTLRETFTNILQIVKQLNSREEIIIPEGIMRVTLKSEGLPYDEFELSEVYKTMLSRPFFSQYHEEFHAGLRLLKEREYAHELSLELQHAQDQLARGKVKEAVAIAKNIKFVQPSRLTDTQTLLLSSLEQSRGFQTGITALDDSTGGFMRGNLMGLAGDTGSMKTRFSLWFCMEILLHNPTFRCLYFEKEMHEKDVARLLISMITRNDIKNMLKSTEKATEELKRLLEEQSEHPIVKAINRLIIVPSNSFHNAYDMYEYIDSMRPDIWCLDFMTLLSNKTGKADNYYMYIVEQMEQLKNISIATDSFGIILSQLSMKTIERRTNKIPLMDDIEWGGKLKQFAAYVYCNFYPKLYHDNLNINGINNSADSFYLIGRKNRHNEPIDLCFKAVPQYCHFYEPLSTDIQSMKAWINGYKLTRKDIF